MSASRLLKTILALAALAVAAGPALAAPSPLRVMTFNVRLMTGDDGINRWELRRDLLVETIREQHPDVFGTQELFKQQGDYIVAKLPQYAWFGMGRRGDDSDEHMGVFYRTDKLRVLESGDFWLSDTPEVPGSNTWGQPFPRMVTWARFEVKATGRRFVLYNTHLPYRAQDEAIRTRCAQEIFGRLRALPAGEPIVLTGDFNTSPDSETHAVLTQMLTDTRLAAPVTTGPDKTFHDFTGVPDQRIDWILVRGFRAQAVHTVTTHRGAVYPSDHFPVLAELAWPEQSHPRPTP
jgi:endonuclease/exonuclease/phosphatase family metal-dependent hydrolase